MKMKSKSGVVFKTVLFTLYHIINILSVALFMHHITGDGTPRGITSLVMVLPYHR